MNSKKTLCIITCSEQKIWDKHKDQKIFLKKLKPKKPIQAKLQNLV